MQLPELVCPAGNLPALKAAVDHGADCVYLGLNNDTNARHSPGSTLMPQAPAKACATLASAG